MSADAQTNYEGVLKGPKMRLQAPCPTAKGKYSQLSIDVWEGNPRIAVRTNDPSDQNNDNGFIRANLNLHNFMIMLEHIESMVKEEGRKSVRIECRSGKEQSLVSTVVVGRKEDGRVFIGVKSSDSSRPVIEFIFHPIDFTYHPQYAANNEPIDPAKISQISAMAYVRILRSLIPSICDKTYKKWTPNENGGNNGGRNGGWKGNKGGNGGWKGNGGNWKSGERNNNRGGYDNEQREYRNEKEDGIEIGDIDF